MRPPRHAGSPARNPQLPVTITPRSDPRLHSRGPARRVERRRTQEDAERPSSATAAALAPELARAALPLALGVPGRRLLRGAERGGQVGKPAGGVGGPGRKTAQGPANAAAESARGTPPASCRSNRRRQQPHGECSRPPAGWPRGLQFPACSAQGTLPGSRPLSCSVELAKGRGGRACGACWESASALLSSGYCCLLDFLKTGHVGLCLERSPECAPRPPGRVRWWMA